MYAIAFDLKVDCLRREYGDFCNKAYDEIREELEGLGFECKQCGLYISTNEKETLASVYKAINKLSNISWFKNSVRDIRAFKVEDYSNFTDIVKGL